ncbi:MAG TPA: glycine cleavage system protein GcvH [Dehalococcoidia bacterium]|nr:glycine cleavage system protein GcvH [Dehalococcoidia bacterium]
MEYPSDRLYAETHEWIRMEADIGTVGISYSAQEQLGDVVFVELPDAGTVVTRGDPFGVIESAKAAVDLNSPVSGEVISLNEDLPGAPELVNESPYDRGWMITVRLASPGELDDLLDAAAYAQLSGEV